MEGVKSDSIICVVVHACVVSTYKTVRLLPRPWKLPEGTVNHMSLRTLLMGVMMHIMDHPGITCDALLQKYAKYLQPVPLFELIEVIISTREMPINVIYLETSYQTVNNWAL